MKFASVRGITLHYAREGRAEGVLLVFVNSLGTDLRIWDRMLPHFAAHFPIVRYDKRGHGLSDLPPGPYSIREHADDLIGLIERLNIDEVILIGISVGGMIALDAAARHPRRVRALVLSDTAAKIGTPEFWDARVRMIRENGFAEAAKTILQRWFAESFAKEHPADYQGYYNMLSRTPVEGYIATCQAIRNADLRQAIKEVTVRTLVLCGAEDAATPPSLGLELSQALPNARFERIEKAGHLPCIEQPEIMAAKIKRFLEENDYA